MTDRFATTLTCTNRDCDEYLIPVEVETIKEGSTGVCYSARSQDDWCEGCGAQREEAIETVSPQVRRRYGGRQHEA